MRLQVNCQRAPDCAWTLYVVVGLDNPAHVNHHEATVGDFDGELGVAAFGVGGNTGHVVDCPDRAGVVVIHLDLDQTQSSKSYLVLLQVLLCVNVIVIGVQIVQRC